MAMWQALFLTSREIENHIKMLEKDMLVEKMMDSPLEHLMSKLWLILPSRKVEWTTRNCSFF